MKRSERREKERSSSSTGITIFVGLALAVLSAAGAVFGAANIQSGPAESTEVSSVAGPYPPSW